MQEFSNFLLAHWLLALAWCAVVVIWIVGEVYWHFWGPQCCGAANLVQLLNKEQAIVVDIRDADAYRAGHISGAWNILASKVTDDNKLWQQCQDKLLILVCADGQQSSSLTLKLQQQSKQQVAYLGGGINQWQQDGLPLIPS